MLKNQARGLPDKPGIYMMKDRYENIIYIGKAKNLKNRVSQYFQSSRSHAPKIEKMIENITAFEHVIVDTELEALLLECRMIKDLKPMYNSQLKNDLGYVYLKLIEAEGFSAFEAVLEKEEQGKFFGPYAKQKSVERALEVLQDNLRIRSCRTLESRKSGCTRYQLGLCSAPCTGEIGYEEYQKQIEKAVQFLEGKSRRIIEQLESKMTAAAEALDFNRAARYRDDASALKRLSGRQQAIEFNRQSRNILALEKISETEAKLFILKGSHIVYKEKLKLPGADMEELKQHILELAMTYAKTEKGARDLDKHEIDQAHILYSYLKNKKDCSYMIVPAAWLKKDKLNKLEQAIEKLLSGTCA